jgi:hypothetical protein
MVTNMKLLLLFLSKLLVKLAMGDAIVVVLLFLTPQLRIQASISCATYFRSVRLGASESMGAFPFQEP